MSWRERRSDLSELLDLFDESGLILGRKIEDAPLVDPLILQEGEIAIGRRDGL